MQDHIHRFLEDVVGYRALRRAIRQQQQIDMRTLKTAMQGTLLGTINWKDRFTQLPKWVPIVDICASGPLYAHEKELSDEILDIIVRAAREYGSSFGDSEIDNIRFMRDIDAQPGVPPDLAQLYNLAIEIGEERDYDDLPTTSRLESLQLLTERFLCWKYGISAPTSLNDEKRAMFERFTEELLDSGNLDAFNLFAGLGIPKALADLYRREVEQFQHGAASVIDNLRKPSRKKKEDDDLLARVFAQAGDPLSWQGDDISSHDHAAAELMAQAGTVYEQVRLRYHADQVIDLQILPDGTATFPICGVPPRAHYALAPLEIMFQTSEFRADKDNQSRRIADFLCTRMSAADFNADSYRIAHGFEICHDMTLNGKATRGNEVLVLFGLGYSLVHRPAGDTSEDRPTGTMIYCKRSLDIPGITVMVEGITQLK